MFIKNGGITKPGGGQYNPAKVGSAVHLDTGDIYYGYSGATQFNPSKHEILPELQALIDNAKTLAANAPTNPYAVIASFEKWSVENCAEIYAVNNALRGGADINSIFIYTKTFNTSIYAPPCKNCLVTFKDFLMLSIGG